MLLAVKLIVGASMIGLTVILHAIVCDLVLRFLNRHSKLFFRSFGQFWAILTLSVCVFAIGSAIMADIWMWTLLLYYLERRLWEISRPLCILRPRPLQRSAMVTLF